MIHGKVLFKVSELEFECCLWRRQHVDVHLPKLSTTMQRPSSHLISPGPRTLLLMSGAMIPMRDAFAEKEKKTKLKLTPSTAEVPTIMGLSSTFALCSTMHQVSERYWVSFRISHRMSNITSITTITRVGLTSLIGFGILTVIQAFIFLHEMFHVDAISAPNQHIGDLWLNPGDGGDWEPAYGADFAKLVARAQNPGG